MADMVKDEIGLNKVDTIMLCDACLDGRGEICHTPGCVMIRRTCPDFPIREDIESAGGTITPVDRL